MEALLEVMEGKKLRKRGKEVKFQKSEEKKRENIEALYERLKIEKKVARLFFEIGTYRLICI